MPTPPSALMSEGQVLVSQGGGKTHDPSSYVADKEKLRASVYMHPASSWSSHTPLLFSSAVHGPPHCPRASRVFPAQSQDPTGISVQPHSSAWPGPLHTPQSSNTPTQGSMSSQIPSWSRSAVQVPPHCPRASKVFPPQSQAPSEMTVQPHSNTWPGPLHTPQSSSAPTQGSMSSQIPSWSRSVVHDPPQMPRTSSWFPSQSHSSSGMLLHPHWKMSPTPLQTPHVS